MGLEIETMTGFLPVGDKPRVLDLPDITDLV